MKMWLPFILITFLISCKNEPVFAPKPRMYPRIINPDRNYVPFDKSYCDLTFLYPDYASIVQDTLFFEEKPLNPCWFDIEFTPFNGKLHCSYYPIESMDDFDELIKDAFTFADKHDIKANYRAETQLSGLNGTGGILFEIDGPVASPLQFFLTDTTNHFIRGSLYFNNQVNPDSMAPVHAFVGEEIKKMIETLEFQDN